MTSAAPPSGEEPGGGDQKSMRAGLTASLLAAVAREVGPEGLTPVALARAVVEVLPADGASLSSMVSVLRLPLGASDDFSGQAESLQSTLGEGPCLEASETQTMLVAGLDELRARWPLYADALTTRTPFRAVAAIPLHASGRGVFAALDVYSTDPRLGDRLDPSDLEAVGMTVGALLAVCVAQIQDIDAPETGPDWYRAAAGQRHEVWVAIGMVMATRVVRTRDALSLLRARAYASGRSLDDLAGDVVRGRLSLTDLTD